MSPAFWRGLFVLGVLAQSAALYWPSTPSIPTDLPVDKGGHLLMFAAVAFAGVLAGVPVRWLVAGLLLQAVLSEFIQGALLPGRGAEPADFVADVLGIAVGTGLGALAQRAYQARRIRSISPS